MPGDFGVGEPAAGDRAEDGLESPVVGVVALVEREHPLVQVAEQVERLDADVGAVQAALEQAQKFSIAVRVDVPVHVAFGVVDGLVGEVARRGPL